MTATTSVTPARNAPDDHQIPQYGSTWLTAIPSKSDILAAGPPHDGAHSFFWALWLGARDLRVFPLKPREKSPLEVGFMSWGTGDTEKLWKAFHPKNGNYRACNVGVLGGLGLVVVDADVKDGKPGLESLAKLVALGLKLDFVVDTPSGGKHVYARCDPDAKFKNDADKMPDHRGIDIRSFGGLVVAPGMKVTEYGDISYKLSSYGEIPAVPDEVTEIFNRKREGRHSDGVPCIELDLPDNVKWASDWLVNEAPEAIQGTNGDDTTVKKVAMPLHDMGISHPMALDLMLEHWNYVKASPPWDEGELDAKIASAYASCDLYAPGGRSAFAEFDPVDIERPANDNALDFYSDPADFIGRTPPEREWVVEGCIPKRHVTLLYGDGGLGKTLLGQQLATSMVLKREWMGRRTAGGLTLCVFSEDDTDEIWRRQIDINNSMSVTMEDIAGKVKYWTADHVAESGCVLMNFNSQFPSGQIAPFFNRLDAAVKALKPSLIILDPIANMFGGSEIDRAQVTGFVNRALKRLCVQHDTTVLALAHPSVAGMSTGSGMSGSTGWNNAVRSRLYLKTPKTDPTGDYRELDGMKANYGKRGRVALMRWTAGAFVVATGSDGDPQMAADRALLSALRALVERGDILSNSPRAGNYAVRRAMALPEVDGMDRSTLEGALERLLRAGAVRMEDYQDDKKRAAKRLAIELPGDLKDF